MLSDLFIKTRVKIRILSYKYRSHVYWSVFLLILVGWMGMLAVRIFNLAPDCAPFNWFSQRFVTWQEACLAVIGAIFAYRAYHDAHLALAFLRNRFSMFDELVERMCKQLPAALNQVILLIGVPAWGYATNPILFDKFWEVLQKRLNNIERGHLNLRISIVLVSPETLAKYMWNLAQVRALELGNGQPERFFQDWVSETLQVLQAFLKVYDNHEHQIAIFVRDDLSFRGAIVDNYWAVLTQVEASPADCSSNLDECKRRLGSIVNFPTRGFETKERIITDALNKVLNEFLRTGHIDKKGIEVYKKQFNEESLKLCPQLANGD